MKTFKDRRCYLQLQSFSDNVAANSPQEGASELQNVMEDLTGEVALTEPNHRPDAAGFGGGVRKE